jgi:hypothetical protein
VHTAVHRTALEEGTVCREGWQGVGWQLGESGQHEPAAGGMCWGLQVIQHENGGSRKEWNRDHGGSIDETMQGWMW